MGILTYLIYPIRSVAKNRMRSIYAMTGMKEYISRSTPVFEVKVVEPVKFNARKAVTGEKTSRKPSA